MQNFCFNRIPIKGLFSLNLKSTVIGSTRSYLDPCKHYEPKNLKWQWEVRKNPETSCPKLCVSKQCPKKSWFPRIKKHYVPKDKQSCRPKKKRMTFYEYFSYLLPDRYTRPRPPLVTCRRLQAMRREKCVNPYDPTCLSTDCCPLLPEWRGQGIIQAAISCNQPCPPKNVLPQPCPPPQHMVPRCVMVKKGICPLKATSSPCMDAYKVKMPYGEFKETRSAASKLEEEKFTLRSNKVCHKKIPVTTDKSIKLSCSAYGPFKSVECPKQLYTRYQSVDVPPICTEELCPIKPVAARAFKLSDIKAPTRGICPTPCELKMKFQPRGVVKKDCKKYHTSTVLYIKSGWDNKESKIQKGIEIDNSYLQPSKNVIDIKKLVSEKSYGRPSRELWQGPLLLPRGMERDPKNRIKISEDSKMWCSPLKRVATAITSILDQANKFVLDSVSEPRQAIPQIDGPSNKCEGESRSPEVSTIPEIQVIQETKANQYDSVLLMSKKEKNEGEEGVCAGCRGVLRKEEEERNPQPKKVLDCRTRVGGDCQVNPLESDPDSPPISNPYWDHKPKTVSPCNRPRKKPQPVRYRQVPCDENRKKRKYHTSTSDPSGTGTKKSKGNEHS